MPTLWLSFLYIYELSDCGQSLSLTAQLLEQAQRRVCLGLASQWAGGLTECETEPQTGSRFKQFKHGRNPQKPNYWKRLPFLSSHG